MAGPRVAVAASGGRDSTALLHCVTRAAAAQGVQVVALHVHHGLSAQADAWAAQVRGQARRWGADFAVQRLATRPAAGDSVEAWARRERYRALGAMAHAAGCSLVLLAHHRRDQAETWLLQALRSGGAEGLASMPRQIAHDGLVWCRPWLGLPREAVEAYARRHRLAWVDDASNADARYARNRLRLQVWPALQGAFPDAEVALAGAAVQAAHAAALAAEAAALDLPAVSDAEGLRMTDWLALPPARRRNALRAWLQRGLRRGPPGSLLDRLMAELPGSKAGRWPAVAAELRLHRGRLVLAPADTSAAVPASPGPPAVDRSVTIDLSRPGTLLLPPWQGRFVVHAALEGGALPARLQRLQVRERRGGERFQPAPDALARSLKKQFQASGVPAWERDGPLLFDAEGQLLFVPGLGIDARARAAPGAQQLLLTWVPDRVAG
ncbi:MAG: tRNA lysidine(34) synthetase TilS [Burkholderiales bacterium]|nr:tRNA lysidine(34) synthetase TilS [Burkholderiales bacterium]MDE2276847.1 tRNA lysidine(34) synthetase TilS [Burkholderiales bacterium]